MLSLLLIRRFIISDITSLPLSPRSGLREHKGWYSRVQLLVSFLSCVITPNANGASFGDIIFVSVKFAYKAVPNQLYAFKII